MPVALTTLGLAHQQVYGRDVDHLMRPVLDPSGTHHADLPLNFLQRL